MNKVRELPSQARLREMFDYNVGTGELIWRERPLSDFKNQHFCNARNSRFAGKVAGGLNKSDGYLLVRINRRPYKSHRLIYAWHHGACPADMQIDHINGDKADNRIENLRLATNAENSHNVGLTSRNSSGFKGVSFHKARGKYQAYIGIGGKLKYLGYFDTAEEAAAIYTLAAEIHHGKFVHASVSPGVSQ